MKKQLIATFGSDPELCLFDRAKNKIVSSIPVLKKDKHSPIDLGDGIKMYADNVLVESSFKPSKTKEEFINRIRNVLVRMQENLGEKYRLLPKAAHIYDSEELDNPRAWEVGCNPNYDVYAEAVNMPAEFKDGLRSGSFHIHLGNDEFKKKNCNGLLIDFHSRNNSIKVLDIFLGTSSIIFDKDESSLTRRKLYGKAGEHRPTPYGLEYRVLGNYALRTPKLVELVFDLISHSLIHISEGTDADLLKMIDANVVKEAINTNNADLAEQVLTKAGLPDALLQRVKADYNNPDMYKTWGI